MKTTKKQLSVAAFAADKKSMHEALKGVYIAPTYTVATDGSTCAYARYLNKRTDEDAALAAPLIVNALDAERARKALPKGGDHADLTVEDVLAHFNTGVDTVNAAIIDERYPDVERLIKEKTASPVIAKCRLNADYLIKAAKFAADANGWIDIEMRGSDSACLEPVVIKSPGYDVNDGTTRYSEAVLALVMPIRIL